MFDFFWNWGGFLVYFGAGPIPKLKPKFADTVTDTKTTF